jgi:hypothetical protein
LLIIRRRGAKPDTAARVASVEREPVDAKLTA